MNPILVFAEVQNKRIQPVTLELAGAARMIQDLCSGRAFDKGGSLPEKVRDILIVVADQAPVPMARQFAKETGLDITALTLPDTKASRSEVVKEALASFIKRLTPSHVLVAHTALGRAIAPVLAVRMGAASIAGVIGVKPGSEDGGPVFTRPVLGNTRIQSVRPEPDLAAVITLVPGAFPGFPGEPGLPGGVLTKTAAIETDKLRTVHVKYVKPVSSSQALKNARIVVGAGRGIGEKENLEPIARFAGMFSSSALAASRPLVDMGWIGYDSQVGITGASIAPDLYIACGISGSSQHLAGIKDAKYVISINKNPDAPICRHADLCIIADSMAFVRELQLKAEEDKGG